ncbi:MAG TPA: class I SAM-dependent methyltransferase [Pseudomonadales bacterium]|nr:class I SAM-dependent methyltransferase [Pseudomonadales bacterium]
MSLSTIDFGRLGLQAGERLLDVGCGEGRHTLGAWLEAPVHAVGLDLSRRDLDIAEGRRQAFEDAAPEGGSARFVCGSALDLPFPDASFDVVVCSEVLEHIFDHRGVLAEISRVLKPGGRFVTSVPRAWPERLCWALSDPYHEAEGGHIRIFDAARLRATVRSAGFRPTARHWAHALHVPYWWLRCAAGGDDAAERSPLVRAWHRMLVWDLMQAPRLTRVLERLLNPLLGKSVVLYFVKEPA